MTLAPIARGALWMVAASAAFAVQGAIVKYVGLRLDPFVIAFFNAAFGFLFLLPAVAREGREVVTTKRPVMHLLRGFAGAGGLIGMVYSMVHLPLADATAIAFTKPLFGVLLAGFFLAERVSPRRWFATVLGFTGVLFIVRPGSGELELAHLVALIGAFCAAEVIVLVKKLQDTERNTTILIYFSVVSCLLCMTPAALAWTTPSLREFALLAVIASLTLALQYCTLRAYRVADASAVVPYDYTRLLFAATLGYLLFAELPDHWTLTGIGVICVATLYLTFTEVARRKPQSAAP